jgi:hypothetical protein
MQETRRKARQAESGKSVPQRLKGLRLPPRSREGFIIFWLLRGQPFFSKLFTRAEALAPAELRI